MRPDTEQTYRERVLRVLVHIQNHLDQALDLDEHVGPYDALGETYARLCGEWLPGSGRELRSAPAFEVYRNSPFDTPPEGLLTDVLMPLEPR